MLPLVLESLPLAQLHPLSIQGLFFDRVQKELDVEQERAVAPSDWGEPCRTCLYFERELFMGYDVPDHPNRKWIPIAGCRRLGITIADPELAIGCNLHRPDVRQTMIPFQQRGGFPAEGSDAT